jgi:hypothetical protein
MAPPTLVYILGTGHCGSTLLDLLLNGHPDIHGGGELAGLRRSLHGSSGEQRRVAGSTRMTEVRFPALLEDPFWQEVQRHCVECGRALDTLKLQHPAWAELARWSDSRVGAWAAENVLLLDCVHQAAGRPIVTDSSKHAQRLYLLRRSERFDLKVIHLARDGRAVLSSHLEKRRSFGTAYRAWAGSRVAAFGLRRRFADECWIDLSYEALCREPRGTLDRVCRFLGVGFAEEMLAYRSHPYHGVGGNRMRVAGRGEEIFLDESWRQQLRPRYRIAFDVLGGWADRTIGVKH